MPSDYLRQAIEASLADRYRVERELGAGGMATVYLAHDLRHDREVAIKVLHPELGAALGADRFLAEIKTTARLQHPHILPLLDSGDAGGNLYYVMPFVAGETLRSRLERERQLPIDDAVRIGREVADALSHAHAAGVVHRDIKPENILLQDGHARVADFGIALAVAHAGGQRLTQTGLSVGTPQYMAPEQAMGEKAIDARADIYSLGAVLYEALSGEPPFTGPTAQAIVARVITETPRALSARRRSVPGAVDAAVLRALEKLPADRFSTAAEFAAALEGKGQPPRRAAVASSRSSGFGVGAIAVGAVALLAIGGAAGWLMRPGPKTSTPVARATIALARGQLLSVGFSSFDISPDGTQLAYVGVAGGRANLFLRPLADTLSKLMPGTEGATEPFFSPDGKWIGFFLAGKLVKMPRDGGVPITIANVPAIPVGISWGNDGTILFNADSSIYRVSSDGRSPAALVKAMSAGKPFHGLRFPFFLPDQRDALVTTDSGVAIVHLASGEVRHLLKGGQARYLPTGHIMYDDGEGRVRVVGFDPRTETLIGTPRPAFEAFRASGGGASFFAASSTGTLVYMPGGFRRSLVWVDRNGHESPLPIESRGYRFPRLSPDGHLIAVDVDPRPSGIWVLDPVRGSATPITPTGKNSVGPTWSADGKRVVYQGTLCICAVPAEGGAEPAVLFRKPVPGPLNVEGSLRDGRLLGVRAAHSFQDPRDIIIYSAGDTAPNVLLATPADDRDPAISPDEHWLAYSSSITGTLEIYVQPFPGPGPSVRVSNGGGQEPRWSHSGDEIFYRNAGAIMAARVSTSPRFRVVAQPDLLFESGHDFTQDRNWDVGPDGRFLMVRGDPASGTSLRVVFNWFEEVRETPPR
jgi:Tol biopolymer transport system component